MSTPSASAGELPALAEIVGGLLLNLHPSLEVFIQAVLEEQWFEMKMFLTCCVSSSSISLLVQRSFTVLPFKSQLRMVTIFRLKFELKLRQL